MAFYGKVEYWDSRYQVTAQSDPCEWYCSYGHLRHLINPIALTAHGASAASSLLLAKPNTLPVGGEAHNKESPLPSSFPNMDQSRVLILGCGNSTMGADMLRDGWTGGIVGIDFSETVIAQMKEKYVVSQNHAAGADGKKQLDFVCADVTKPLDLWPDASFDLILCKGALDAVLCSPGSRASALAMVSECTRLLAPGHGIFFLVTAGNPDSRLEYLEYQNELAHYWRGVSVHPLKDELLRSAAAASNVHGAAVADANKTVYCYICRKRLGETGGPSSGKENVVTATNEAKILSSSTAAPPPPCFEP